MADTDSSPAAHKPRTALILALALLVAGGAGAIYYANTGGERPTGSIQPETPDAAERLAEATELVLGGDSKDEEVNGVAVTTVADGLIDTDFGPVLITQSKGKDDCHACEGFTGVAYLKVGADGALALDRRWPGIVPGWGNGQPSELARDERFTTNPAFIASGGFTGQGVTATGFRIVELTPTGPLVSEIVRTGLDTSGMFGDEDPDTIKLVGEPVDIVKDRSFAIRVKGTEQFDEAYRVEDGRFVPTAKDSRLAL